MFSQSVAARNVGLAQKHEVVDVIAGVEQKPAHRAVGHNVVGYYDWAHMKVHKFLNIFHSLVER